MGTKADPGPFDCYAAAEPDEPLFVLKSTDESAPTLVRIWAELYRERKMKANRWTPAAIQRYCEALECANQMAAWRHNKLGERNAPMPWVPTTVPGIMALSQTTETESEDGPPLRSFYGAGSSAAALLDGMAARGMQSTPPVKPDGE